MKTITVEQGVSLSMSGKWLPPDSTPEVLLEVALERRNQHEAWGQQDWNDGTGNEDTTFNHKELHNIRFENEYLQESAEISFANIFLEEVFEVMVEKDESRLREELIQVAAVAVQWVEAIDRRRRN